MPSIITHAVVGAGLAASGQKSPIRAGVCAIAALCAALPDVDVVAFALHVPYGHPLGHRGLSHSLAAAAVVASCVTVAMRGASAGPSRLRLWVLIFLATASHGVLDMCTDGGQGVAILAPWDSTRYFLPWRPIAVSPIGLASFLSDRGRTVLWSEIRWVWLPTAVLVGVAWIARGRTGSRRRRAMVES